MKMTDAGAQARAALTARGKGINGALLMDAEDTYDQKTASFATLPDIIDRFMQMVSAASGVPMTRLFGISAAGLNATRSEEHTSELQSRAIISYAVFCL